MAGQITCTAPCGRCNERRVLVAHGALCQPCLDVLTLLGVVRESVGARVGAGVVVVGQHFYNSGPTYDALLRLLTEHDAGRPSASSPCLCDEYGSREPDCNCTQNRPDLHGHHPKCRLGNGSSE